MRIVVTHASTDWDAITSVWLIKRYLPEWQNARVRFVPAGQRLHLPYPSDSTAAIEKIKDNEVLHVDTGLGPLDHHQTNSDKISAASLTWKFVLENNDDLHSSKHITRKLAIDRIVAIIVDSDHFKEVFWPDPIADYHEMSYLGILEGYKLQHPKKNNLTTQFGMKILDAVLHNFENRIWAEQEMKQNSKEFQTIWGKGIAFESINDSVLDLAQKMGYIIVFRKDPRKGYVRIKARPQAANEKDVNLKPVFQALTSLDPDATWYLHVSNKMLLNGSAKNSKMRPTRLTMDDIIHVLETIT